MLWASLHYLKFRFATEEFTMGLIHEIIFRILLHSPYLQLKCFRCTFYTFMKSINYLFCRFYPSRSSITNMATSEFIQINVCSKMLLQHRVVNPLKWVIRQTLPFSNRNRPNNRSSLLKYPRKMECVIVPLQVAGVILAHRTYAEASRAGSL